jgi:hypothetical protein
VWGPPRTRRQRCRPAGRPAAASGPAACGRWWSGGRGRLGRGGWFRGTGLCPQSDLPELALEALGTSQLWPPFLLGRGLGKSLPQGPGWKVGGPWLWGPSMDRDSSCTHPPPWEQTPATTSPFGGSSPGACSLGYISLHPPSSDPRQGWVSRLGEGMGWGLTAAHAISWSFLAWVRHWALSLGDHTVRVHTPHPQPGRTPCCGTGGQRWVRPLPPGSAWP